MHCDIKPSNIGYGEFKNGKFIFNNQIFLLDYSHSTRFIYKQIKNDNKGHVYEISRLHYLGKKTNKCKRTYNFMSLDILEGLAASRKSELENLIYVLIYLYNGTLPWEDILVSSEENKVLKMKN